MDEQHDLIIIGGGPAGLSAAVNSVMRGCKVMILDSGYSLRSRAEKVGNYPGPSDLAGLEMMDRLVKHALRIGAALVSGRVSNILPMDKGLLVSCGDQVFTAKAVILATGEVRAKALDREGKLLMSEEAPPQSLVTGLQIEDGFIQIDRTRKTNIPGLYACGDCTGPPFRLSKATGDGLIAGLEAAKYVNSLFDRD